MDHQNRYNLGIGFKRGMMKHIWKIAVIALIVLLSSPNMTWADEKSIERLTRDATVSSPEGFRLANARALVAALMFEGSTLSDLDSFLNQKRAEGVPIVELTQAINEAKAGNVVDVCISAQDPPAPVQGVNLAALSEEELERFIFAGSSELKRAAAREIVRKLTNRIALGTEYLADEVFNNVLFDIAKPFNSLYEVRTFGKPQDPSHEEKVFDEYKIDLIQLVVGSFVTEAVEEAGPALAQVYYTEYLVWIAEQERNDNYASVGAEVVCEDEEASQ